jgi:hypothetical protein
MDRNFLVFGIPNMSEIELHKRIEALERENHFLRTENKRLRETLGMPFGKTEQKPVVNLPSIAVEKENTGTSINKYSDPESKIELFMSLFRGRTDVYAKRCYSKNQGSSYLFRHAETNG